MAQIIKSVIFFDYDSLCRSLRSRSMAAADAFGQKSSDWLAAIERGDLLKSSSGEKEKRRVLMRRCYADPRSLGPDRSRLIANGIQIVDCPTQPGMERSSADIHMALDAIDALEHATGFEEFILLSADSDFSPVLFRLRAHNRHAVVYGHAGASAEYRGLADAVLEENALLHMLGAAETAAGEAAPRAQPAPAPRQPKEQSASAVVRAAPADGSYTKEELTSLVRRIHQATRVPLFSPRLFGDLFRLLVQEISENGYRFQTTAENVADKLAEAGRNATRRQVGFVVKGLALKGHMFSAEDTVDRLAGVFRDQVIYLAKNAGIDLTEREKSMVAAWVGGRPAQPAPLPVQPAAARKAEVVAPPQPKPAPPQPKAAPSPQPAVQPHPAVQVQPEPPAAVTPPPVIAAPPPQPAATAADLHFTPIPATPVIRRDPKGPKPKIVLRDPPPPDPVIEPTIMRQPPEPEEIVEIEATEVEEIVETPPAKPGKRAAAAAKPVPGKPAKEPTGLSAEEMESSILAAIAEAVDVLVEDRATDKPRAARPAKSPTAAPAARATQPQESEEDASDDIGDEIQRILASYSQNRERRR